MKFAAGLFLIFCFALTAAAQSPETMTIKVFFHNEKLNPNMEDCNKAFPTLRTIPKTRGVARAALDELFKGTTADEEDRHFRSFPPANTKGILKSINIKRGAAYVNFNKVVYQQLGSATTSCGGGFFASVDATLMQFPTIRKVFYAIEGSPKDFYDWVQVGECPKELKKCDGRNFK